MGARMALSRGLAAPDAVPGLGLGRDSAREAADRSLQQPTPTRHNQRSFRHPPSREYAHTGRPTERRPRPPYAWGRAARTRRDARGGRARGDRAGAAFARASVLGFGGGVSAHGGLCRLETGRFL